MAPKGKAPVISLLSSDDEVDEPVPRKPASSLTSKENVRPRSSSREPAAGKASSKPASTAAAKPSSANTNTIKPKPSSSLTPPAASKPSKKAEDTITISSSASPEPEPSKSSHPKTKDYSKIFGGLSSDPILSQSSPVSRPNLLPTATTTTKPPTPQHSALADLLGSSSEDEGFSSDPPSLKRSYSYASNSKSSAAASRDDVRMGTTEPVTKRRKVDLHISSSPRSSPEPYEIPPSTAPGRKSKLTEAEKLARAAEREEARKAKAAEKEAVKEQKRLEREAKVLQRTESQAMSSVNKLKTSHVQTVGEMIVNISSDLYTSTKGAQLRALLTEIKVNSHAPFDSVVPNIVKWKRVKTARWDAENDVFIPMPRTVEDEHHVLTVVEGKEFVTLADTPGELDLFIARIKTAYPTCTLVIIIEGLEKLIKKSQNNRNKAYTTQVRNQMEGGAGGSRNSRAKKTVETVNEENIEDARLRLQVVHKCMLCETQDGTYTAESIGYYTQHISQIPYKHAKSKLNESINFCMDVGQVTSGRNAEDTYNKMLQTVHMSTAGVAGAIQSEYPTMQRLFKALQENGEEALKDIRIARTGNGRALGPAMSKKIARVLTGTDPDELES